MAHARSHSEHSAEHRVLWALVLTGSFMVAEALGGFLSGSLALLADAGHMLTDTAALALSWYAVRASRRPPTPERSYGHARFEILAALINGAALIIIALWIVVEAAQRLASPVPIESTLMLAVAAAGLIANIAAFFILRGSHDNLNIRGALLHVAGDMLGSLAAIAAALVILATGWTPIDPILSVFVALLIVRGAWLLAAEAWHVLMEGAPPWLDVGALKQDLMAMVPGVVEVHHVHAWLLTPERPLITLHAYIAPDVDHDEALHRIQERLQKSFGLSHATVQIERAAAAPPRS